MPRRTADTSLPLARPSVPGDPKFLTPPSMPPRPTAPHNNETRMRWTLMPCPPATPGSANRRLRSRDRSPSSPVPRHPHPPGLHPLLTRECAIVAVEQAHSIIYILHSTLILPVYKGRGEGW
jgi:hypothetical protein